MAEVIEDIYANRDRDYNIRRLVKRLQRIDKEMSGEARDTFAAYIPEGDMARYASGLPKHAANEQETLYTATERVQLAIAKISARKSFAPEQLQWLDRIEAHLAQNLTIEQGDFDSFAVFEHAGGWGRANRVFEGKLPEIISQLNEAIAS